MKIKKLVKKTKPRQTASKAPAEEKKRIFLVDDHPMMRAGLSKLINKEPELRVCCEANTPNEMFCQLKKSTPHLLLADMTMPGRSGLDFINDVMERHPNIPVLVLSMHDETLYAERVLRAGARGYIMKDAGGEKLLEAIRRVLNGGTYVSEEMSGRILDSMAARHPRGPRSPIETLSAREFEVFQLIGQGKTTREIAQQLRLSPKTVDVHRGHLKDKLKLKSGTSLIRYAVRWMETASAENSGP